MSVPDLPGCFSAGDTLAEALERAREAIALHVEGLLSDGEPVPAPSESVEADGGVVGAVEVDDGLLSEQSVQVNISIPSRLLAVIDRAVRRTGAGRSGLLTTAAREYLSEQRGRRTSPAAATSLPSETSTTAK